MASDEARMHFFDHLEELRERLIRGVILLTLAFCVTLYFSQDLFRILSSPILAKLPKDTPLIFTRLQDPFFTYFKLDFLVAFMITLPYIIFELWRFIAPGLHAHERRLIVPFVMLATFLFYAGAAFAYYVVFPAAFTFFLSYQTPDLKAMIGIREYMSLVFLLMLAFGIVFETPMVIVFLGLLGVVDRALLKRGRRYFIVIAFVAAAALSPTPDVLNQSVMAVTLIFFYEVGIIMLKPIERRRKAAEDEAAAEEQPVE